MKPIAIFYHCYFFDGYVANPNRSAIAIVREQMITLKLSGLDEAASHISIGVNGGGESKGLSVELFPKKSHVAFHGLQSKTENPTIHLMERWAPLHPGWNVLYFHCKGASRDPASMIGMKSRKWRDCMMHHLIMQWKKCVEDLESGIESVGVHWIRGLDATQNYWAGNFWWATSDYLASLPPLSSRGAIRQYGLESPKCRYEAEVWIGNGSRLPIRKDYHPQHIAVAH